MELKFIKTDVFFTIHFLFPTNQVSKKLEKSKNLPFQVGRCLLKFPFLI